ncbi:MAG: DUF3800 domain-containing protein [Gammaproteobacteria bacterium]|nr:DUF3800 domain-containing protein [Gammaproteobacteria bacterium]
MLAFIDESGCPGFKLARGSTTVFVVAMVVFKTEASAKSAEAAISRVRAAFNHKSEFKFSKCRNSVREAFLREIAAQDFAVRAIVVRKQRIHSRQLRTITDSFYNYFVKLMMQHDQDMLADAIVKIDESGNRKFKKQLESYLKRELGNRVKKIRFVNSKGSELIQLADMVAGAVYRAHREDSRRDDQWLGIVGQRIQDIWEFPNAGH